MIEPSVHAPRIAAARTDSAPPEPPAPRTRLES